MDKDLWLVCRMVDHCDSLEEEPLTIAESLEQVYTYLRREVWRDRSFIQDGIELLRQAPDGNLEPAASLETSWGGKRLFMDRIDWWTAYLSEEDKETIVKISKMTA